MKPLFVLAIFALAIPVNAQEVDPRTRLLQENLGDKPETPAAQTIPSTTPIPRTFPDDGFKFRQPDDRPDILDVPGLGILKKVGNDGFAYENFIPDQYIYTEKEAKLISWLRQRQSHPKITTRTNKFFNDGGSGFINVAEYSLKRDREEYDENPVSGNWENFTFISDRDKDKTLSFWSNDWRYITEPIGLTAEWENVFWSAAQKAWIRSRIKRAYYRQSQALRDQKEEADNGFIDAQFKTRIDDVQKEEAAEKIKLEAEIDEDNAKFFATKPKMVPGSRVKSPRAVPYTGR